MRHRGSIAFLAGLVPALAAGWLAFPRLLYVKADQPLRFSHKTHAGEAVGLACEDCHALRADGTFTGIPAVAKCAECHAEPVGESADEKRLVEDYVKPGREIPWRVYARQPDNAFFPHAPHVKTAAIACERCHGPHGQTDTLRPHETNRVTGESRDVWGPTLLRVRREPWQGMKMSDCEGCHLERGRGGTACIDCHK
jgi:hypothetical protein